MFPGISHSLTPRQTPETAIAFSSFLGCSLNRTHLFLYVLLVETLLGILGDTSDFIKQEFHSILGPIVLILSKETPS